MAIAWMIARTTPERVISIPTKSEGSFLAWLTLVPSFALFIARLAAVAANSKGIFQYAATVTLGSGLLYYAIRQVRLRSRIAAQRLLKATIVYLPLEFLILVLGKGLQS